MKKYSIIKTADGTKVPHSTVRGLILAIQHKSQKDGTYKMTTNCGNIHTYEMTTTLYTTVGRAKGKVRMGKGTTPNTKAKLIKVERI